MKTKRVLFGVSVKMGKFRANRIEYDARGRSTVTPLCEWTDVRSAVAVARSFDPKACALLVKMLEAA